MIHSTYPPSVVIKAFTWAYQEVGLNQAEAADLLGVSETSLSQTTLLGFEHGTTEYRRQLSFIRMYHLLIALSEGDSASMQTWFQQYQSEIKTTPKNLCFTSDGIERVTDYLRELKQTVELRPSLSHLRRANANSTARVVTH
ncbi:hypothetical protein ALT761_03891 [Alteromonas sp. 76-1]|jgi:transcriptional regulator with XRE-family HTH domain|uniref:hypothetical protein n=1 Tax=unclassified Alteromonas TaxID=2614992 RepID=UPI000C0ECC31|nr:MULTISPECIES: hypothetical protein [unclassified Alteromonas]MBO7921154.1 hypothetical protein [Alteromonas sp. K632G]PHS58378.1 MAG: hypothetical protein COB03_04580 [Alteromonas sp.]VEL98856.1 hypothetical protein ALT761_03891 [Alteromonas sp. 76-1]|tara:strand:- start:5221 stop:5646 length:426 start_codon:yes stop_codon:yes gene_type:complete